MNLESIYLKVGF